MAKKDKNSLLNIHYSRTLTSNNLSKAANYVGEYVLKGLGTLGRFLNAGFTSPTYGTTGQVSYARNAEDAKRLREQSEASEQAMGKAMTWISPLNYGTALVTGNGLNARKGEEEVASWSPAWLAAARLGELYVGPKGIKAAKAAPKTVVNAAAKTGVKPAKTAVIAREINNVTKKRVQNLEKIQPEIRTRYGDVEIDNPELAYRLVGKGAVENFLKTGELFVPVKLTGNKLRDALNNMMGGTPMYKQGSLWYGLDPINYPELFTTAEPLAIGNKHATIVKPWIDPGRVIKKGIRTGEIDYAGKANLLGGRRVPFTEDLLNLSNVTSYKWVPGYGYKLIVREPSTSLKFFERKPSKLTEAEKAGVPKTERNLRLHGEPLAPYYDYSLINRTYNPWKINEKGLFVFESPEKAKKLSTIHFSMNEPVLSHIQGSWDDAPTVTLLPYRNIRSLVAPADVAIMDTFFPNYNGLKVSSRKSKTLTGDKNTYDYYKSKGIDVEFSPGLESLRRKIRILDKRLESMPESEKFSEGGYSKKATEMYDQRSELAKLMDNVVREWSALYVKTIPNFKKLNEFGKAEGFNTDKYPYSFGSPDKYGSSEASRRLGLDYTWVSDPSNHAGSIQNPSYALKTALESNARPEYIKWLSWLIDHKADYRKQGGKMNILEFLKNGGQIRKMQTAAGGPIINGGTPFSITVKGKDKRPAWKRMYLNPNLGDTSEYYNGNILEGVIGLTPGVGDAIDAVKAVNAVNNKDYATAGFLGAGLLLPNIIEKPLKFAKDLYKGYKTNKMMKAARKAFDESGDKLEVDAFKSGSKPMYVTPAKGPGSDHINIISDELKDSKYFDLERPFGKDKILTLRYYINEGKLKQIIGTYKDLYKDRLGLYTNDVDKIYNYIISNPKLLDLNVNSGTSGLLDIIGVSLGYGPKDAVLFKIGYNGLNVGEKVSKDAIESMKTYGYDRTLPGIYNILKKNIERGTLGVKSTNTNGGHIGFGYVKNRLGGMLQLLRNGSGIHIKKKNRGKFTSYCGGKVTDECIRKAKASGNPTLVKRATFAANARKWKHLNGGILKAQFGTNLDVDNRSDTTRKGYGSMPYFGAANNSNTAGLWDLMNYNVTGNPNIITGEPTILPGKVNMSLYKDAKYLLKGPQYDERFVNFVDRLAKGKIKPSLIGTYKEPVTKFVDLESESIPKGYVKGNEVTPDLRYPISEEGLTVRTVKPIKLENPITNEAEAAAARDWLAERLPKQLKTKPSTKPTKPAVKKEEPIVEKKGVANPKSTSTERYHDNKNYSRKIRQLDKYTRSMETEKASPSNSGNFRVRRLRDEEDFNNMENYPVFRKIRENLIKRRAKWEASGNKQAKAQWMKDYKDALDKFRKGLLSNKQGGIIKADEGTKLTAFLKAGNYLNNSGLGSFLSSATSNILSANKKNDYLSEQGNLFKSLNEESYNKLMSQLLSLYLLNLLNNFDRWSLNYQAGLTQDNPSLIVSLYLTYQLMAPSISNLEKLFKLKNKAIDLQISNLKANTWIDTIGGLAQSGIGLLANKKLATSA